MEEVINNLRTNKRLTKGTARHDKGKERVHEILKLSREILAFEGYANFTLRNICSRLNISMGNLNYYFKTKHNIIHALIEETIQNYENDLSAVMEKANDNPEEQILAQFNYLIKDLKKPLTRGFFFQLYGMSVHDPYIDKCKMEFYQYGLKTTSGLIKNINPTLSKKTVNHKALLILAMVEGLMVVLGSNKNNSLPISGFEKEFHKQTINIATSK
jgi:AcrR family transcriptional regulator